MLLEHPDGELRLQRVDINIGHRQTSSRPQAKGVQQSKGRHAQRECGEDHVAQVCPPASGPHHPDPKDGIFENYRRNISNKVLGHTYANFKLYNYMCDLENRRRTKTRW